METLKDGAKSWLMNCHIVPRKEDKGTTLFDIEENGTLVAKLDGYLICPKEMFTERQLSAATNKYMGMTFKGWQPRKARL